MFQVRHSRFLVTILALTAASSVLADDGSSLWSQWRGPHRDGRTEAAPWPASLNDSQLVKQWSVTLQPSYSGPVVWGDTVFTTETVDERVERVVAIERQSGKTRWTHMAGIS